ncbi:hypothetical protein SOASR030_19150 [Leminorella grimontii]|uniref:Uncharacterized protein n=1 Tax=Leminorella grimontii TaxID=82981 RepID=A0AAV5N2R1_9GAMM|nr:hypothetical protein [Leminorella grimontii]KFC93504.1 hypothetical protein GLGR_3067 [Leminorella grimontii ATCC 33999 = DSM 5078]GKX55803.1 hypothetical protein SOASR030_19150 [Leminorella grimontii]VFS55131.1 Uncharacterised protein [Leminorella grimontii]
MNDIEFDEVLYPVAWRLNSKDCRLSSGEKRRITLLNTVQARRLWDSIFPFSHLMEMPRSFCTVLEKRTLDFDDVETSSLFFTDRLQGVDAIHFLWGRNAGATLPVDVFIASWDDFFYPSDESSAIVIPNDDRVIFSYEEHFFYARIN